MPEPLSYPYGQGASSVVDLWTGVYLHELTDSQEIGQGDVIATKEGLPLEEHVLQLVQHLAHLSQSPLQLLWVWGLPGRVDPQHLSNKTIPSVPPRIPRQARLSPPAWPHVRIYGI